jgi:hypothetical protein
LLDSVVDGVAAAAMEDIVGAAVEDIEGVAVEDIEGAAVEDILAAGVDKELEAAFDDDDGVSVASPMQFTAVGSPVLCLVVEEVCTAADDVEDDPSCSL